MPTTTWLLRVTALKGRGNILDMKESKIRKTPRPRALAARKKKGKNITQYYTRSATDMIGVANLATRTKTNNESHK